MNDAHLIGLIVNGDAEAVRVLIERYQRPLGAVLHRALGASPDLDDVFQETWIRVVRSAHRYDPAQRFSAWLFAIAWNLVKDRWAKRGVQAPAQSDADLAAVPSAARSPEEVAVESDRARHVREMVARLPERLAQAILLRYFEELCSDSVAAGSARLPAGWGLRLPSRIQDHAGYVGRPLPRVRDDHQQREWRRSTDKALVRAIESLKMTTECHRNHHSSDPNHHSCDPNHHSSDPNHHSSDPNHHSSDPNHHSSDPNHHSYDRNRHSYDRNHHSCDPNHH